MYTVFVSDKPTALFVINIILFCRWEVPPAEEFEREYNIPLFLNQNTITSVNAEFIPYTYCFQILALKVSFFTIA